MTAHVDGLTRVSRLRLQKAEEEEVEWVAWGVAGAGLGAVYPALSCSDIVESTLSLTERENFETFLWPVRHTRSSKTWPRPTKSGWAPLSSAA